MITLRLPPKIERKLARAAKKNGSMKSAFVREALLEHLEEEEDVADAVMALRRLECGEEKTVSLEEVARRHAHWKIEFSSAARD